MVKLRCQECGFLEKGYCRKVRHILKNGYSMLHHGGAFGKYGPKGDIEYQSKCGVEIVKVLGRSSKSWRKLVFMIANIGIITLSVVLSVAIIFTVIRGERIVKLRCQECGFLEKSYCTVMGLAFLFVLVAILLLYVICREGTSTTLFVSLNSFDEYCIAVLSYTLVFFI